MVSLQGNAGLLMGGLAAYAGSQRKSNNLIDRDLTAGMNTKQLAVGSFGLASSDYISQQVKNRSGMLGAYSDDAVQVGLGMLTSEVGNRVDDDMGLLKPLATGMLLSGGAGVISQAGADLGSLAGQAGLSGNGGTAGMTSGTQTVQASSFAPSNRSMNGGMTGGSSSGGDSLKV